MKKIPYILFLFLLIACHENSQQPIVTKDGCSLPVQFTDPNAKPLLSTHSATKLSPDGTKLFFSNNLVGINVLDLINLSVTSFDIRPLLPDNTTLGAMIPVIYWCPYDNTKFVTVARLGVDTVGDGKKHPGGYHLLICSIDGTYYRDITPKVLGPIGSFFGITLDAWSPNSTEGNDRFLIGYRLKEHGYHYYGFYNPDTQELEEIEERGLEAYTYDWKYKYYVHYDSIDITRLRYYINDDELIFKDFDYARLGRGGFSPDGKLFAIAANINESGEPIDSTTRLAELWIVDVEEFMSNPVQPVPVKIINIKDNFCMFSYGLHPVFTSNNTIAVTMFKAGDDRSLLYEIDLDGNLVRQLTF